MPNYYTLSGKYDPPRTIIAVLVLLLLVPILSFIYNMVNTFIPIIYANFFIAVGYGILLGFGLRMVASIGKIRNNMLIVAIGGIVALVAIYTYWHAFIAYVFADFSVSASNYLASLTGSFLNVGFFDAINQINEFGTWGIGSSPDNTVNGIFLWIVWIAEMLIIGGIPLFMVLGREIHPYSEEQETFYERFTLERAFGTIYAARQTLEKLSSNPLETLQEVPDGRAALYTLVSVYYLPGVKYSYLDVDQISIGEKGKSEETAIIDNLEISTADAKRILDAFPHEKQSAVSF